MPGAFTEYFLRLLFALFIGGVIGIEREFKGKPAGMRTNMLICTASCLLMVLSIEIFRQYEGIMGDPGRIASQVVVGIGFLGAGTIIRSRFSVTGLTSAATIWFVAAIGLVIGWGSYLLAVAATVLVIVTLTPIGIVERHLAVRQRRHILQFKYPAASLRMGQAKKVFFGNRITPENIEHIREGDWVAVEVEYEASDAKHKAIVQAIKQIDDIEIVIEY